MFGKYLNNVPPFRPVGFDQWMAIGARELGRQLIRHDQDDIGCALALLHGLEPSKTVTN